MGEGELPGVGELVALSKEIRAECQQYFPIIDEEIFCHLFSTHHGNRERGLNLFKDELVAGGKINNEMS
jgi:hypothetical protein